jgi:hypothetical protein
VSFKESLNIQEVAKREVNKVDYWFRKKFNISPKDPRYLNCESWELELEYEMDKVIEEEADSLRNFCPNCNSIIYGNYCSRCKKNVPAEKYFDPNFDEYFDKVTKENEDFFGSLGNKDKWEEVKDDAQNC